LPGERQGGRFLQGEAAAVFQITAEVELDEDNLALGEELIDD
jgi:hypothetical protein